jgi:tetratricopeptide (TPR) repeat protein
MVGVRGCTRIHRHLAVEKPKERQRLFKWFGSRQARAPSAATNVSSSQQIAKSLDALVVEADRLQAHNDYAGIVTLLIPESARFSSHAALLTTLGFALYMLARYREAIRVLDQALALEPANHGALKFMVGSPSLLARPMNRSITHWAPCSSTLAMWKRRFRPSRHRSS